MADGEMMLSRSFKYHRPRGVLTACGQDANTLVQIGDQTNVLADRQDIEPGMVVTAQNVFGGLDGDYGAWLGHLARFMPVGFYYKAFYKPYSPWRLWEKLFRRLTGLGVVNREAVHGYYDKQYLFADVAVIGGGPAGGEKRRRGGAYRGQQDPRRGAQLRPLRRRPGARREAPRRSHRQDRQDRQHPHPQRCAVQRLVHR